VPIALTESVCPAEISAASPQLQETASEPERSNVDWCRIDMRVGGDGVPQT
jgi:hypothetical protein